ncbi:hypothetical protein F7725_007472 [Dissostichus mawsoni]|uniref:Uncharacterized protein n=1 Tax=Dissostichus mawsoni TaxID=36200 RepID=A0A7J5Y6I3_DISMA|nr:hypothetical protein F7725_007472 [Dissostichus mawsoni]
MVNFFFGNSLGRSQQTEWEAVRFEVENICKEESFICPVCTPDMLAVSVDGNRKHYRFKHAARSEEKATFEGFFIAKDEELTRFVDYIHRTTKHVSGRGVCGGEWSAARETSQRSTSKVDEEGLELAVCRHGVLLCALNMYRGEMFAYPLFLQEKLSSRQITFFCMDVTCKYWPYLQKVAKSCPELQHLLNMKPFLSVFHAIANDFKCEVKWSEATHRHAYSHGHALKIQKIGNLTVSPISEDHQSSAKPVAEPGDHESANGSDREQIGRLAAKTTTTSNDADSLASRIEVLVASIKTRSQRLYKDADGSKGRARIRRKIRTD